VTWDTPARWAIHALCCQDCLVKVDIYSDVTCPWCYLGSRRLAAALTDFAGRDDVQVEWKPFQLDPSAPVGVAEPALASLAAKFGGDEDARRAMAHVSGVAAGDGLALDLERAQTVNTFAAHRLIWWARQRGGPESQRALVERLFAAHFMEAADLSDHAVLAVLAADVGLPGAAEFLVSGDGTAEVKEEIGEARALGIESVPTFVFDERWAVSGAQPVEVMRELLERVADASIGVAAGGGCCGGDCCG
jgi:predicted DsbA family dithiol-disulfide isomerase